MQMTTTTNEDEASAASGLDGGRPGPRAFTRLHDALYDFSAADKKSHAARGKADEEGKGGEEEDQREGSEGRKSVLGVGESRPCTSRISASDWLFFGLHLYRYIRVPGRARPARHARHVHGQYIQTYIKSCMV